jgi:NADPH2:quinone reductase
MLAAHLVQSGPPEDAIEIVTKEIPEPASDEVRLEVKACGMQHADVLQRKNFPTDSISGPHQMGSEIAGVVDAVGTDVTDWSVGDRVNVYHRVTCGRCEWCTRGEDTMCINSQKIGTDLPGGFGEYVTVPAGSIDHIPDSMDFITAAAYSSSYTTAWRMIVTAGKLQPSERALILGASGGVGNAALQIADRAGAFTFATTSTPDKAKRIETDADHVINYEEEPFDEVVREMTDGRGVDLVADHVGQKTWQKSINSLAKNGRMMICGATTGPNPDINIRSIYQHHRKIIGAPLGNRQDFRDVGRLIAAGELTSKIDRVLPLEEIAEGHQAIEEREVVGKIIVEP